MSPYKRIMAAMQWLADVAPATPVIKSFQEHSWMALRLNGRNDDPAIDAHRASAKTVYTVLENSQADYQVLQVTRELVEAITAASIVDANIKLGDHFSLMVRSTCGTRSRY